MKTAAGYEYHSATGKDGAVEAPDLDHWEGRCGVALVHDIGAEPNLPAVFDQTDVLYAEPPFRPGYEKFHDRAGVTPKLTYPAFIAVCSQTIKAKGGVLIVGRHAEKYAAAPTYSHPVELHKHGWEALALWYGMAPDHVPATVDDIIRYLAARFECVGDFCCGYGVTGRHFAQAGKRFVLSDVVPSCIGYLAEHADGWCTDESD